jgi:hypothetical protein
MENYLRKRCKRTNSNVLIDGALAELQTGNVKARKNTNTTSSYTQHPLSNGGKSNGASCG